MAAWACRSELTATITLLTVNRNFTMQDCANMDDYLTDLLISKNVPIDFSNPRQFRADCSVTPGPLPGGVASQLTYTPIFDGLPLLVSLARAAKGSSQR